MHNEHDTNLDVRTVWADHINEAYYDGMGSGFGARTRARMNWMCSQATGTSVLDVGCSQGIASILLAREGLYVTGIDIDQPAIDYALRERAKEIESVQERLTFHCVDLSSFPLATFDTVIMGEVVEHQTSPVRLLKRAAEFLAPGGRLIVTVPFGLNPWPDHKSTIFPGDLAQFLPEDFVVRELAATDGYIRLIADKSAGTVLNPNWDLVLEATRAGALDVHQKYYDVSDQLQELRKQKVALESATKVAQVSLETEIRERNRLELKLADEQKMLVSAQAELSDAKARLDGIGSDLMMARAAHATVVSELDAVNAEFGHARNEHGDAVNGLRNVRNDLQSFQLRHDNTIEELSCTKVELDKLQAEHIAALALLEAAETQLVNALAKHEYDETMLGELRKELDETTARLVGAETEVEGSQQELARVFSELRDTKTSLDAATARVSVAAKELERLRLVSGQEKQRGDELVQRLEKEKIGVEKQLGSVRAELSVAQFKRTGHYLHLEAERAYGRLLQERMRELHEENYRFHNSLALAVGRAVMGLRTLRGVAAFPGKMLHTWQTYRNRDTSIPALKLPKRTPVELPSPPDLKDSAQITSPVAEKKKAARVAGGDATSKELSAMGWVQQIEPGKVTVMSVMDEFSRACFAPHANLVEPRPDNWEALLERYRPQFLFVESSWKGNYGTWQYRVANYANPPGNEISEMVAEFKRRGIPTVFWNKEDPVHFKDFIAKAASFDYVFTTAEEALPNYSERTTARLGVLQFAAEDALHNPIGSSERNSKVCFAGSFYANRFQERRDDQLMLLDAARDYDLDIFDRNYKPNSVPSDFSFPERFSANIRGSLPYSEVNDAYRRYRVFLNVNSVVDSPTMFSRRVFELLACGTPVVSTWSEGTEATFGNDLIWHVRSTDEAKEALAVLMSDDREWTRRSLQGIREVFAKHTYRHRFNQISESIGVPQPQVESYTDVLVVAEARSELEVAVVMDAFQRQQLHVGSSKRLVVVCRGDFVDKRKIEASMERVQFVKSDLAVGEVVSKMWVEASRCVIALMSAQAVYGRFYLQDLINALRYSGAQMVGKSLDVRLQYSYGAMLEPSSLVIAGDRVAADGLARLLDGKESFASNDRSVFAADQANYSRARFMDLGRIHDEVRNIEI